MGQETILPPAVGFNQARRKKYLYSIWNQKHLIQIFQMEDNVLKDKSLDSSYTSALLYV